MLSKTTASSCLYLTIICFCFTFFFINEGGRISIDGAATLFPRFPGNNDNTNKYEDKAIQRNLDFHPQQDRAKLALYFDEHYGVKNTEFETPKIVFDYYQFEDLQSPSDNDSIENDGATFTDEVPDGSEPVEIIQNVHNGNATEDGLSNLRREPLWLYSGKFQGDIDGVDAEELLKAPTVQVQYNALRSRQLIWPNAIVPYELDTTFLPNEVRLLQKAFRAYKRRTCIRFRLRRGSDADYLNVVKGHGCYSQVGRTGGKQEISLGRGCLFNETIIHELMHSLGFWHEHSRSDREDHINIKWENILPGMDSQFEVVSAAIQDTMEEPYDYQSIMHYGSTAFSRNGKNTLEAVVDKYTKVIGTAVDLSELDVIKINKLYRCRKRDTHKHVNRRKVGRKHMMPSTPSPIPEMTIIEPGDRGFPDEASGPDVTIKKGKGDMDKTIDGIQKEITDEKCIDHFVDCPNFRAYCRRISFFFLMRDYCPRTCGQCAETRKESGELDDDLALVSEKTDAYI